MINPYTINPGQSGPRVLILAGVHGDEYEPMLAAMQLLDELPDLLIRGCVTIVPVVNEAAYVNGSRCACDGIDMARICPGNKEGSVTEQAADAVSLLIKEADYLIDMHTGGLLYDIYPMVGYMLHSSPEILEKQQQMAIASGFPLIWGTDSRPNGRTLSVARDHNVPAVYFEYGGGTGFREEVVERYKEACIRILAYQGLFEEPFSIQDRYNYWLEDERPDSGHLQIKMPAPVGGVFIALAKTGEYMRKGQLFGEIADPLSKETHPIFAGEDGLVFLLRTNVHVKAGEALGGILAVDLFDKKTIKEIE
ncbi:succinylglutamate desuccinylase [Sphingobacterium sp. SGG-5]|uniref:succinylglutamate desuccinylase/aspartoacylase family protein n=1 Tax=Sphingobacterium sp. SGG-5 TaxID=2710881 RepID=UPI0013EA6871|nr:M14 family metallopeptidase [Sphingobacterium sp. SGG-5]NGM62835.1 succinylglutamate desuccinylase [Sphingobacterium sp. SGG-5]